MLNDTITAYVYATNDPQGWDHALYHNNVVVCAIITGSDKTVRDYINDNYDDPDIFGSCSPSDTLLISKDCEYINL